jgi:hypothetical protein
MNKGVSAVHTVFLISIAFNIGRLPVLSVLVSPNKYIYSIWLKVSYFKTLMFVKHFTKSLLSFPS